MDNLTLSTNLSEISASLEGRRNGDGKGGENIDSSSLAKVQVKAQGQVQAHRAGFFPEMNDTVTPRERGKRTRKDGHSQSDSSSTRPSSLQQVFLKPVTSAMKARKKKIVSKDERGEDEESSEQEDGEGDVPLDFEDDLLPHCPQGEEDAVKASVDAKRCSRKQKKYGSKDKKVQKRQSIRAFNESGSRGSRAHSRSSKDRVREAEKVKDIARKLRHLDGKRENPIEGNGNLNGGESKETDTRDREKDDEVSMMEEKKVSLNIHFPRLLDGEDDLQNKVGSSKETILEIAAKKLQLATLKSLVDQGEKVTMRAVALAAANVDSGAQSLREDVLNYLVETHNSSSTDTEIVICSESDEEEEEDGDNEACESEDHDGNNDDEGQEEEDNTSDGKEESKKAVPIEEPVAHVDPEDVIYNGDTVEIKRLLETGYDVETKIGEDEETLLEVAAASLQLDVVKLLVQHGAKVTTSALKSACGSVGNTDSEFERIEIVEYLVEKKAEVTVKCLFHAAACEEPSMDVVTYLLKHCEQSAAVEVLKNAKKVWTDAVDNLGRSIYGDDY